MMTLAARLRLMRKRAFSNGSQLNATAQESEALSARFSFLRRVVMSSPANAIPRTPLTEAAQVVQRLCALDNQFKALSHEAKRLHAETAELYGQLSALSNEE
jgi:hypothetical protein